MGLQEPPEVVAKKQAARVEAKKLEAGAAIASDACEGTLGIVCIRTVIETMYFGRVARRTKRARES